MERIDTQRLYLRELQFDDAKRMAEYRNKREVAFYQSWYRYPYKRALKRVEHCLKHPFNGQKGTYQLAVILKKSDEMIGDYFLEVLDHESLVIGYTFDSLYWHHGYARESMKALLEVLRDQYRFKIIYAHVYDDNYRSIRLLESMSFKQFDASKVLGDISFKLKL